MAESFSDLDHVVVPAIEMPWPSALHPDVAAIEEAMLVWADRHGLVPDSSYRDRVRRDRYGWLAARCYPRADREVAQFAADFVLWFFLFDDLAADHVDSTQRPAAMVRAVTGMLDVMDIGQVGGGPGYGQTAMLDLCQRLRRLIPAAEQYHRWAAAMRMWFLAVAVQVLDQQHTELVTVRSYIAKRRYTGGMFAATGLADSSGGGSITPDQFYRPEVQRLSLHANNVICWSNDLVSFRAEAHRPTHHNLVSVTKNEVHGRSWQDAVNDAARRLNTEIAAFADLAEDVRRTAGPSLSSWIDGCQDWMAGNIAWSVHDTDRYRRADGQRAGVTSPVLDLPIP